MHVTARAAKVMREQLAKRGTPNGAVRFGIRGGGCTGYSYMFQFEDGPRAPATPSSMRSACASTSTPRACGWSRTPASTSRPASAGTAFASTTRTCRTRAGAASRSASDSSAARERFREHPRSLRHPRPAGRLGHRSRRARAQLPRAAAGASSRSRGRSAGGRAACGARAAARRSTRATGCCAIRCDVPSTSASSAASTSTPPTPSTGRRRSIRRSWSR